MSLLKKFSASRASQITSRYELDEEIEPLLTDDTTPAELIGLLMDKKEFVECVRFIAHGLPKREAVWWACLASRSTHTPETEPLRQQTLKITEAWVRQPTEELRQQAEKLARKCKHKTPESWAATAAFWSAGSILDSEDHPMPAPPFLYAHGVSGAVGLAAVGPSEEEIHSNYLRLISQGLDLASGGKGSIHDSPYTLIAEDTQAAPA